MRIKFKTSDGSMFYVNTPKKLSQWMGEAMGTQFILANSEGYQDKFVVNTRHIIFAWEEK